jgi:hypothetical protein
MDEIAKPIRSNLLLYKYNPQTLHLLENKKHKRQRDASVDTNKIMPNSGP